MICHTCNLTNWQSISANNVNSCDSKLRTALMCAKFQRTAFN